MSENLSRNQLIPNDWQIPRKWVEQLDELFNAHVTFGQKTEYSTIRFNNCEKKNENSKQFLEKKFSEIAITKSIEKYLPQDKHTILFWDKKMDPIKEAQRYLDLTLRTGYADIIYPKWGDSVIDLFLVLKALPIKINGCLEFDVQCPLRGETTAKLKQRCIALAALPCNILIVSPTGTGKETIAKMLYIMSMVQGPFVSVSAAAIPDTLFEAEFFGTEKGAFTDAKKLRRGLFEKAENGVLFIDEVADLSPLGQLKLLRALSERHYCRVGGDIYKTVKCRVISATNQERKLHNPHLFREDLRARLEQQRIASWTPDRHWEPIRPLSTICSHIPLLFSMEIVKAIRTYVGYGIWCPKVALDIRVIDQLRDETLDWRGNYRQLQRVVYNVIMRRLTNVINDRIRNSNDSRLVMRQNLEKEGLEISEVKLKSKHDEELPRLIDHDNLQILLNYCKLNNKPAWKEIPRIIQQEMINYLEQTKRMSKQAIGRELGTSRETIGRHSIN